MTAIDPSYERAFALGFGIGAQQTGALGLHVLLFAFPKS
jgi:hypothetical protein